MGQISQTGQKGQMGHIAILIIEPLQIRRI